ncbi:hypothetical protein DB346_04405 [Verrucomicrobia bacterium LW23]|nr:hypothetical protein DB346_04405 [Verrucomicrobia bacterium LW23]
MTPMFSNLLRRTAFPSIADCDREAQKLAVLRIALGLIITWRCAFIARDSYYFFDPVTIAGLSVPIPFLETCVQLLLALGLTLGIAPAACALILAGTHMSYSLTTATYHLGPLMMVPLLAGMAVLDSGRLCLLAKPSPAPAEGQFQAFYLILFTCYAALSFQAVFYHLHDTYWFEGRTSAVLFVSSYLSSLYTLFRWLEAWSPDAFWYGSMVVTFFQTVFQLAMLPLVFTRIGKIFVIAWGGIFIVGSIVALQLSILPFIEVIYWVAIFAPAAWFSFAGAPQTAAPTQPILALARIRHILFPAYVGVYALVLPVFFANCIVGELTGKRLPPHIEGYWLLYVGIVAPNVFNKDDLSMGDRWPVIEWKEGAITEQIPFNGHEGERLPYHRSDLLYYGNSLHWRRGMVGVEDLHTYHQPGGPGYNLALQIATYDFRRNKRSPNGYYQITLYRNKASNHELRHDEKRYTPEKVLTFNIEGKTLTKAP